MWPDLVDDDRILVVPVGSVEQHGPHLPLDTDTRIAVAVARGLAAHRGGVVVGPAVPYTASGEHQDFPGTLSVGHEALECYLLELARSAARTYRRVLFVNGHGGNVPTLDRLAARLCDEWRDVLVWHAHVAGGDAHAGWVETSLLLAIDPHVVRLDRIEPGTTTPLGELWPQLRDRGVRAVAANGVLGDPTGASAQDGRRLLTELVDDLAYAVDGWVR
ncbi:MAG: mycofactocin biosynthesis peptidyl-dipeptidase MftE [Egibacteraceae bacterium]